ncbi:MAG: HAMP domain-containing sensor histidine kinase [Bacteroidota bacterium]
MTDEIQELRDEISNLQEQIRLFPSYLSGLAHDIRTPLNSIVGFADLLKESNISRNEQRMYSQMIVRSSRKLMMLMSNLIDLARIETGHLLIYSQKIVLPGLLEELSEEMNEMKVLYGKPDIQTSFFLQENVPEAIQSDRNRILQIIRILIDNSLKFTSKGKISLEISCSKKYLVFKVIDTGCGMSKETIDSLFTLFPTMETPESTKMNTRGMSLLVAKLLCEKMGIVINVMSQINKGTAVSLSLPV